MTLRFVMVVVVLSTSLLSACGSPLVGAECAASYIECDGQCIDPERDDNHCGGCGNVCDDGVRCMAGTCGGDGDGDVGDGDSMRDDGGMDGGDGDGDAGDGDGGRPFTDGGPKTTGTGMVLRPDAGLGMGSCPKGLRLCGEDCVDVRSDLDHCGACDNVCNADEVCNAGVCDEQCADGLLKCGVGRQTCFDPNNPRNCGACGKVCQSGICRNAECLDALPGHIVVIGHDYIESNPFKNTILGNAVFLGGGNPIRTLIYEGEASAASLNGVEAAIALAESNTGRVSQPIKAIAGQVTEMLEGADVFLIHAQARASDDELMELGVTWGQAMVDFVRTGGVIVLLDAPSNDNAGTYQLLEPATLFLAEQHLAVESSADLTVANPGQGIALRVGEQYRAARNSVAFENVTSGGVPVSFDDDGNLVIIDRTVVP